MGSSPDRAPLVRIRRGGGLAAILMWERRPSGWWALVEVAGGQEWFLGDDLEPLEGEDYSRVPRFRPERSARGGR